MKKLLPVFLLASFLISFWGFSSKDNKNIFYTFDTKKFIKASNELSVSSHFNMINNSSVNKSAVFENNWSDDAKNTLVSAGFNPDIFRPQEIFGAQKKEYTIIPDITMTGDSVNQKFGYSVSTAGDVNGDGYADVIVGAPGYLSNTGRAYIYYGGPSMNNIADVILTGEAADNYFGHSVSTAGDVNGDGYADVIV
jgi:hypothetical protein